MLPLVLPNWRTRQYADGIGLFPPEGRAHGGIRIRDRRRPLRAARDLVRAIVADMDLGEPELTPIERLTTSEGEYAAVTTIVSVAGGSRFERTLGFVFGDDFYTQIDGGTANADKHAFFRKAIRELVYYYSIGLGELRRRRYLYQPPPGWNGYPRGLITEWQPPGFPGEAASIAMFPARPVIESPAGVLDRSLHELSWAGFTRTDIDAATPVLTRNRLAGVQWRASGHYGEGPIHHQDIVVLQDDRFFYATRLESSAARVEADRAVFHDVIDSVEPIPHAEAATGIPDEAFDHFAR